MVIFIILNYFKTIFLWKYLDYKFKAFKYSFMEDIEPSIKNIDEGEGERYPKKGDRVFVHYIGTVSLYNLLLSFSKLVP